MLKTPRDIVNDRLSWSSDDAIKNHCVYVLEQYLKEEPELTEQDLREALELFDGTGVINRISKDL
jgi:hypothetical protein